MEPVPSLRETIERLDALIRDRGLKRHELLDLEALSARTALPVTTVRLLLQGDDPPDETVGERVRARIQALSEARLARSGGRMSELTGDISRRLGVSEYWARQVCDGKKVPSVEFLHGLVDFFGVPGGEAFFTASADDALRYALLPVLRRLEGSEEGYPEASPQHAEKALEEALQRFRCLNEQEQLRVLMSQFGVDPELIAFRGGERPSPSQLAALLILAVRDDA